MNCFVKFGITATALVAMAAGADAATIGPAWEFNSTSNGYTNGNWDFGLNFTVNKTVGVNLIGYYDDLGNGFLNNQTHEVALYDNLGTVLAHAFVSSTDQLIGNFRYALINTVTLSPGQTYQVAGMSGTDNYTWNTSGFITTWANYINGFESYGHTSPDYIKGSNSNVANGIFGPNLLATPGPIAGAGLPALLGLVGIGLLYRRQRSLSV